MSAAENMENVSVKDYKQYSTFYIADRWYGIDVMKVQEVLKEQPMTEVPLAEDHVKGLINLRGQIATAISLRELFGIEESEDALNMNVVCNHGETLLSLLVDKIGDVVDVPVSSYEPPPSTLGSNIKQFMSGVYKTKGPLLTILEIERIVDNLVDKKADA